MGFLPTNAAVAAKAVERAKGNTILYSQEDCQAFIEKTVQLCGGRMDYKGSNHMARNLRWLLPIDEARTRGLLVPGCALFILDSSVQPKGYNDTLGDFNHVGLYVGENALEDVDKNGNKRMCNVVHSSATMRRVAGSKLEKKLFSGGWSHAGGYFEIDYSGHGNNTDAGGETIVSGKTNQNCRVVNCGEYLNLRKAKNTRSERIFKIPEGATLLCVSDENEWCKVRYETGGKMYTGYVMSEFIKPFDVDTDEYIFTADSSNAFVNAGGTTTISFELPAGVSKNQAWQLLQAITNSLWEA